MNEEDIKEIIKALTLPKIEIGLSEKRQIAPYETKDYTVRAWVSLERTPSALEMQKMMDNFQQVINEQVKKDGLKPLQQKQQEKTEPDKHEYKSILERAGL